jgi:hypothetical protein
VLYIKTNIFFLSYLAHFFLEWEPFQTQFIEKIETHFMFSNSPPPPRKSSRLWANVDKYRRAGQATGDNTWHAHCALDTKGYRHTLPICNTAFPRQQWLHERASVLCFYVNVVLFSCFIADCFRSFCSMESVTAAISWAANDGCGADLITGMLLFHVCSQTNRLANRPVRWMSLTDLLKDHFRLLL